MDNLSDDDGLMVELEVCEYCGKTCDECECQDNPMDGIDEW